MKEWCWLEESRKVRLCSCLCLSYNKTHDDVLHWKQLQLNYHSREAKLAVTLNIIQELFITVVTQVVYMCVQSHEAIVLNSLDSIESKHEVTILSGLNEFVVKFFGPQGSKCFSFLI